MGRVARQQDLKNKKRKKKKNLTRRGAGSGLAYELNQLRVLTKKHRGGGGEHFSFWINGLERPRGGAPAKRLLLQPRLQGSRIIDPTPSGPGRVKGRGIHGHGSDSRTSRIKKRGGKGDGGRSKEKARRAESDGPPRVGWGGRVAAGTRPQGALEGTANLPPKPASP